VSVRSRRLLIAAACFALSAGAAFAQGLRARDRSFEASETLAADLRRARIHAGPFYLLSSIQLSDLGYEQQFFLPTAQQSGGFSADIAAPQKLYFVPARKTIYALTFTPEYAIFSRAGGAHQWGYLARGEAHYLLNHFYFNPYVQHSDRLVAAIGEIDRVVTQRENSVGLNGEYRYSSKTRLIYAASGNRFTFPGGSRYQPTDVSLLPELDRNEHNYRATLRHQTFPLTALTMTGEWSDYSFRNAPQKDSRRRFFGPGFVYDSGRGTLRAQVGPGQLNFDQPGIKDFKGVLGNASYGHRVGARANLSLAAERDVDFSIYGANNYYIADRASFLFEHQTTRRLTLRAFSTAGRDLYDIPTIGPAGLVRRHDQMSFTGVGWRYSFRHLRTGFDVGYYQRQSNVDIDEQNGIRLALQLSFSP
jgi:hypothetical protein